MRKSNPRVSPELVDACKDVSLEMLERARVVGVLDAWLQLDKAQYVRLWEDGLGGWHCDLVLSDSLGTSSKLGSFATADAARAAAAKAIEAGEV